MVQHQKTFKEEDDWIYIYPLLSEGPSGRPPGEHGCWRQMGLGERLTRQMAQGRRQSVGEVAGLACW